MADREIDLMGYLPEYLKQYKELQQVMGTESVELQKIDRAHQQDIQDRLIMTCGEYGMGRFEKMLGITPLADDSIESRRFRVLARWNNTVPYNYVYLRGQLGVLCGADGYRIDFDISRQSMEVRVALTSKNMLTAVKGFLEDTVPCNIALAVDLLYNQHVGLQKHTHARLHAITYGAARNEVIA